MASPGATQQGQAPGQPQQRPFQAQANASAAPVPQQITTEVVQKYLEENEALIATIVENINANRLKEATQYQTRLQHNLMYLAAIADQNPGTQQQNQNQSGRPAG